jgi:hypothetical protein
MALWIVAVMAVGGIGWAAVGSANAGDDGPVVAESTTTSEGESPSPSTTAATSTTVPEGEGSSTSTTIQEEEEGEGSSTSTTIHEEEEEEGEESSTSTTIHEEEEEEGEESSTSTTVPGSIEPFVQTYVVGEAGSVTIQFDGSALRILSTTAADGWELEIEVSSGIEVEADFRDGTTRFQFKAELEDGEVRVRIRQSDD